MARTTTAANAPQIAELHARIDDLTTRFNDLQTLYTEQQKHVDQLISDTHAMQGINHDVADHELKLQKQHSTLQALVNFVNGRSNKAAAAPAKSDPPFATTKPAAKAQTQRKPAQNRTQRTQRAQQPASTGSTPTGGTTTTPEQFAHYCEALKAKAIATGKSVVAKPRTEALNMPFDKLMASL